MLASLDDDHYAFVVGNSACVVVNGEARCLESRIANAVFRDLDPRLPLVLGVDLRSDGSLLTLIEGSQPAVCEVRTGHAHCEPVPARPVSSYRDTDAGVFALREGGVLVFAHAEVWLRDTPESDWRNLWAFSFDQVSCYGPFLLLADETVLAPSCTNEASLVFDPRADPPRWTRAHGRWGRDPEHLWDISFVEDRSPDPPWRQLVITSGASENEVGHINVDGSLVRDFSAFVTVDGALVIDHLAGRYLIDP